METALRLVINVKRGTQQQGSALPVTMGGTFSQMELARPLPLHHLTIFALNLTQMEAAKFAQTDQYSKMEFAWPLVICATLGTQRLDSALLVMADTHSQQTANVNDTNTLNLLKSSY